MRLNNDYGSVCNIKTEKEAQRSKGKGDFFDLKLIDLDVALLSKVGLAVDFHNVSNNCRNRKMDGNVKETWNVQ